MSSVALIWSTPDGENLIGYQARVSNPANQDAPASGLIKYLIREKHWSPFEMVNMCFEVTTTRAVARQLMRHNPRIQEFSQRYADPLSALSEGQAFILTPARMQHPTNRQMSVPCEDQEVLDWWNETQLQVEETTQSFYETALSKGIAKEVARNILPEGMTPTTMYMNANLRDWLFLTNSRIGHGTQKETETIALMIKDFIKDYYPNVAEAFYGQNS